MILYRVLAGISVSSEKSLMLIPRAFRVSLKSSPNPSVMQLLNSSDHIIHYKDKSV
jgi:hypothetical protein